MQTIQIDIADNNVDTFLTIVSNLKNNMVHNIKFQGDTHYEETKAYFHNALEEIENGKDTLLSQEEYDKQMDEFEKTL
ncbi:MAG: hypothetical protein L3J43_04435 [Sulfurovum sp.]|nr:hypothetical protein [Sulfurovum sp.]